MPTQTEEDGCGNGAVTGGRSLPPPPPSSYLMLSQLCFYAPLSFVGLQSLCLMHTGKPTGVAIPHCITWFQTQLILTMCQTRYHSHLWDHRSTGQL